MRHNWRQFKGGLVVLWALVAISSCADSARFDDAGTEGHAGDGRSGVNADSEPSVSHPALWESTLELVDVSAGHDHTCGLTYDGQIICWGLGSDATKDEQSFDYGQAHVSGNAGWQQVSTGSYFTCGVRDDGSLDCWGQGSDPERDELYSDYDQATPPSGSYDTVSAGGVSACALDGNDTWRCWGDERYGLSNPPEVKLAQVSVGGGHACGVTSEQTIKCWGHGGPGDNAVDELFTQAIPPEGQFTRVTAGGVHTCGIRADGTGACWGLGSEPEHADADSIWAALAKGQAIAPSGQFLDVSAGSVHTCGIRDDHTVECWGAGRTPYRADPSDDFQRQDPHCDPYHSLECNQSVAPPGRFQKVSAGGRHTCALRLDGRVVCWGANNHGQASPPSSEKIAPEIFGAD